MLPTSQNCNEQDVTNIKMSTKITLAEKYLRISLEQPLETHGEVKSFESLIFFDSLKICISFNSMLIRQH